MANKPTDDEQFRSIIAPYSNNNEDPHSQLAFINKERRAIQASLSHFTKYIEARSLSDPERALAHGYMISLVRELRHLSELEDSILWRFFKSSNDAAWSHFQKQPAS